MIKTVFAQGVQGINLWGVSAVAEDRRIFFLNSLLPSFDQAKDVAKKVTDKGEIDERRWHLAEGFYLYECNCGWKAIAVLDDDPTDGNGWCSLCELPGFKISDYLGESKDLSA
jgi:hypothetical protein